jgi:hypothetical protein
VPFKPEEKPGKKKEKVKSQTQNQTIGEKSPAPREK